MPDETSGLDPRVALFVVSGTQGAGKSTVSRLLAQRFTRGAHVEADVLQKLIVSGTRWPESREMSADAATQLRLRLHNACLLARSFVASGITAVVDDIIIGDRMEHLLEELAGTPFHVVMLAPSLDAVRTREAGRGTSLHEEWGEWMDDEIRTRTRRVGLWLDTTVQSADETVDEIMSRAWDEAISSS